MKVLILVDVVANKAPQKEGAEIEVSAKDGRTLIQMGKAVEIKEKAEVVNPAIEEVKEASVKRRGRPKKTEE